MRVAIIHYWFVTDRGGEKVVRALCDLFPDAVIFTHVADPDLMARLFPGHEVRQTFISRLPFARTKYQSYLPLMPLALEQLDLSGFDLIISSESGPAKGVIPPPTSQHICYCHSPMRYLWDQYHLYRNNAGFLTRSAMPFITHRMRQWDVTAAARVDHFVANSNFVAARINKYYRRSSDVVHPPVDIEAFSPPAIRDGAYSDAYLWVGQLTAYKRPDIAVAAFTRAKRKLVIVGEGEMERELRAMAGETITFLGRADFETLKSAYASCKALIFPGAEDFGIVPVEAMASGAPVIAYAKGGALDSVIDQETGVLFDEQSAEGLKQAISKFEAEFSDFDANAIAAHAQKFSPAAFAERMRKVFHKVGVSL